MTRLRQEASPGPAAPKPRRHKWADKVDFPLAHKSERECLNGCGIVKVVVHQAEGPKDIHWTEFWRGLDKISVGKTPACEPVEVDA